MVISNFLSALRLIFSCRKDKLPASPSFYSKPETMDSLLDTVVGRVLDQLGLSNELMPRWGAGNEKGEDN